MNAAHLPLKLPQRNHALAAGDSFSRLSDFLTLAASSFGNRRLLFAPQSNVNLINGLKTTQDFGNKVPFFGEPLMPD
jgi:hypothetical protein